MQTGHKKICLAGYDSLQFGDLQNIYRRSTIVIHTTRLIQNRTQVWENIQQAQFVALLEHINKEYPDVELYFKKLTLTDSIESIIMILYLDSISKISGFLARL